MFRTLLVLFLSSTAQCAVKFRSASQQRQQSQLQQGQQKGQFALTAAEPQVINMNHSGSLVQALEFKHQLRVCNAFPSIGLLDIFRGNDERLTGEGPMPYKACRDFSSSLMAGDKLEFRIGETTSGTFSIADLPNTDAVLLLVIHRHDTLSTSVAFESHVFASAGIAQVAIIDAYRGAARSMPSIMDAQQGGQSLSVAETRDGVTNLHTQQRRSEELRYDSVVAVNPGIYEVKLVDLDGKTEAKSQLVALNHESYVVLRVGVDASHGPSYPQELVIYPNSNPAPFLHSGAPRVMVSLGVALLMAATALY